MSSQITGTMKKAVKASITMNHASNAPARRLAQAAASTSVARALQVTKRELPGAFSRAAPLLGPYSRRALFDLEQLRAEDEQHRDHQTDDQEVNRDGGGIVEVGLGVGRSNRRAGWATTSADHAGAGGADKRWLDEQLRPGREGQDQPCRRPTS